MAGKLRRFALADREAALGLSRHALARLEEQVGYPLWATMEELDEDLRVWDPPAAETLRVVEEDGEVAALGGVQLTGEAVVVGPLVVPRFRGQKLGTSLLAAAIEIARTYDAGWMRAEVGPRNVGGRLLLERNGFRPKEGLDAVYRLLPADHRPAGPAPPGVEVRPGVGDDLSRIWALYRHGFPTGRRTEAVWLRRLDAGDVLVAERSGTVVAYVHLEPGSGRISHVGVAEEARGLGVGGYLFSRAVANYWQRNPERELRLSVIPYDTSAIRLYRRLGFAPWLVLQSFELEL